MINIFLIFLLLLPLHLSCFELTETSKIAIIADRHFIGKKIREKLQQEGYCNFVLQSIQDFANSAQIESFFINENPDFVILSTEETSHHKDYYDEILQKEMQCIKECQKLKTKKILVITSFEVFRADVLQALKENLIYSKENEKKLSINEQQKLLALRLMLAWNTPQNPRFILCIVPEVYGEDDDFTSNSNKAISQLISKFEYAKNNQKPFIIIQGQGIGRRECIHIDDVVDASLLLLKRETNAQIVNIGYGKDISILELASILKKHMNYKGDIVQNLTEDEEYLRKFLDSQTIQSMGWYPQVPLSRGLEQISSVFSKKSETNTPNTCPLY